MATLKYLSQYFSTTLNVGGGIDDSQTTGIILQSVSGVTDITKPGQICITYSDPIDTSVAEWIDYTSINGSNELVGAVRGREGFSAHAHLQGATVAFVFSASHHNDIVDQLNGTETGTTLKAPVITGQISGEALTGGYPITNSSMSRQAIINGNFDVWQRGTTSATLADGTTTFTADRWKDVLADDGGTLPTLTRTRELLTSGDIPNAFYYSRLTTNGAGTSLGVNSYHFYRESIENGVRNLCGLGKKVTVSFYARSSIASKRICPVLIQNYGSGGSPSTQEPILGTPITLTSTWTKYTATFTTNTLVGKTFGTVNDDAIRMDFYSVWGTTWGNTYVQTSVTAETYVGAGYIDIAQVQLCAGDVALPFQPKSFEEELRACQRYYEKSYDYVTAPATNTTVGAMNFNSIRKSASDTRIGTIFFKVFKRTVPTVKFYQTDGKANKWTVYGGTGYAVTTLGAGQSVTGVYSGSDTVASDYMTGHYTADAEL